MLMNVRMSNWKWSEFNPKVTQSDKRDRDGAIVKGQKFVQKNFNELALSSFVAVPVVDHSRAILNVKMIYPPKSPLEEFWNCTENKIFVTKFVKALEDTQLYALELWDAKEKDLANEGNAFLDLVGEDDLTTKEDDLKPQKPIFAMNTIEISAFFTTLLKYLYKEEGVKKFKLWAKKTKNGEIIEEPTKLKAYDVTAEGILPRTDFIGTGSGGPNIGNRLKIVTAYLLSKIGFDHNSYCKEIPANYKDVEIDFDNHENLVSKKTKITKPTSRLQLAKINGAKKRKTDVFPLLEEDCIENPSKKKKDNPKEVIQDEEEKEDEHIDETPLKTPRNLLEMFRSRPVQESPGTPAEVEVGDSITDDDDDEDLMVNAIDQVKEGNVKKAHGGGITTVNIFDVAICESNGFYRASISDGKDLSNKVLFNSKLNKQVEDELEGPGKVSVVRIDMSDILEKTIIGVMAYTKVGEGPNHVGDAQFLGDKYYRGLKPRGIMTPSRMRKNKLFK